MNAINQITQRFNGTAEVTKVDTHTLIERHAHGGVTIYVEAGGDDFHEWNKRAEPVRRQASLAYDAVVGWWVRDPNKPTVSDGDFLVEYDAGTQGFIPYVSITKGNEHDFRKAAIGAFSLVGEATISMKRTGKAPQDPHIWYQHGSQALDDLIRRGTAGLRGER